MSYLAGRQCYLSGPIECSDPNAPNWRTEPTRRLREEFGIDVFDPFEDPKQQWQASLFEARDKCDFDTMERIASCFVQKDLSKVDRADFLVAWLPKGVATTGTHHEIVRSNDSKKPTLLICGEGKQFIPLWYWGFGSRDFKFSSFEELYEYLRSVDRGEHRHNKRWNYVYGMI